MKNIGESILILGCIYFLLNYNLKWWSIGLAFLIIWAVFSWEKVYHPKELKDEALAQIEEIKTRTVLMKYQIRLFAAQTSYYLRGVKPHGNRKHPDR